MNIRNIISCYLEVNQLRSEGKFFREIGEKFNLGPQQTQLIFQEWNLNNQVKFKSHDEHKKAYTDPPKQILSDFQIAQIDKLKSRDSDIYSMRESGKTFTEIADKYDRSVERIRQIYLKYKRMQKRFQDANPD